MKVLVDLCVVPLGVGVSVSEYIAACERVLKDAGLKIKLHSYGTDIEGQGLKRDGYVLINSKRSFDELGLGEAASCFRHERLCTVPASEIAMKHLGRPLPGAVLLGGLAALAGVITLPAVADEPPIVLLPPMTRMP